MEVPSQLSPQLPADLTVLAAVCDISEITSIDTVFRSPWALSSRLDVIQHDRSSKSYFIKVSHGHHGREALRGEYESTRAIHSRTADFCPRPIAWGTLASNPEAHFYICDFFDLTVGLPVATTLCVKLARLHSCRDSQDHRFGFPVTTYNGDLPQNNTWSDSWEEYFLQAFRSIVGLLTERREQCSDLEALLPRLYEKVIPRLLRPLDIEPSLVHGDLWGGNMATVKGGSPECIVFDPASFWGHNEYDLGNWHYQVQKGVGFPDEYFRQYHLHIKKTPPEEDYDDRIDLYALRFNLNDAFIHYRQPEILQSLIENMRRLVLKHA
ncbi:Fructosamine kinase-domain-containing protein [Xylariomycetidae sp. FL0641]|nr:Fructosamine kinase-domain-containing protein [Xylariomycetidae sp. FL0641]